MNGLALALSWLTVVPVRVDAVDRTVAARALRWAPLVGALLGVVACAVLLAATALGVPPLVAGLLAVATLGVTTRGMHLDGLADTADGLGCYGPPERALAVMRDGGAGPFAVATLIVTLGIQAASLAALAAGPPARVLAAVVLAAAAGRTAFAWVCRRGTGAARPDGLGALVADTQPWWVPAGWWLALACAGTVALGVRGAVAVALGAAGVALLARHTARRFGGTTGDVLGATSELATTAALLVLATG